MNSHVHKCGLVNQCGDTMASKHWVADRVVEFLVEDATLGPTDL
jgi:hypothetical protein